jgi:hypothetical protein
MTKDHKLELVIRDFKELNETFLKKEALASQDKSIPTYMYNIVGNSKLQVGVAWFYGEVGNHPVKSIASPYDYLKIKDDPQGLEKFIINLLDQGRIYWGTSYWNQDGQTNPADYIVWLHKKCENDNFVDMLEYTIVNLLVRELDKDFEPLDYKSGMQKALEDFQRYDGSNIDDYINKMFQRDNTNSALSRLGISREPIAKEDNIFQEYFLEEVKKTERPITLKEVLDLYAGTKKDLKKSYHNGNFKDELRPHFDETSDEFKTKLQGYHLNKKARLHALEKFQPQFNRLVGLVDSINGIGSCSGRIKFNRKLKLGPLYDPLIKKVKQGFFEGAPKLLYPNVNYYFSEVDLYGSLINTLSVVRRVK